ncbi:MAG: GIY-YIG nuclease family protein [Deltaproteobacteria bacterium]|jgi:Uri superfamily endonuclease|nr:GIY-YIG nuclease family protein [Deltaproteobacteria bacterium]
MLPRPGTYTLIFSARKICQPEIGRLGSLQLTPGFYMYVGSALGPGGLKARIAHHRQIARRPHWHIDYLGPFLKLIEIWYTFDPAHREHQWAQTIANTRGITVPRIGFGSSDCRCIAHLFFCKTRPSIKTFRNKIHANTKNHGGIFTEKNVFTNKAHGG